MLTSLWLTQFLIKRQQNEHMNRGRRKTQCMSLSLSAPCKDLPLSAQKKDAGRTNVVIVGGRRCFTTNSGRRLWFGRIPYSYVRKTETPADPISRFGRVGSNRSHVAKLDWLEPKPTKKVKRCIFVQGDIQVVWCDY